MPLNDWLNDDQADWVRYLHSLPPEKLCDCGWYLRGECFGVCYGHPDKGGYVKREASQPAGVTPTTTGDGEK